MNTQKIALMVDTCIDVPPHIIREYNMYVVPLKIIYSDGEYSDGVNITPEEVYNRLSEEIPKTSLPSSMEVTEIFDRIKADGYEKVLVVSLSSGLSGTFNLINMLAGEYEGLDIAVIDTRNIGIAAGFTAIRAAQLIEEGMSFEELKVAISESIPKTKVFFCLATLEYLQKGGRIGLVTSILGTALNLKPIISCNEEGVYYNIAKIRGRKHALNKLIELATEYAAEGKRYNVALCHGAAADEANDIKETLLGKLPNCELFIEGQISPALGVHTGPGLIGIAIQLID